MNLTGTLARKEIRNVNAATQGLVSDVSVQDGSVTSTGAEMFSLNGRDAIAENGDVAVLPVPGAGRLGRRRRAAQADPGRGR